MSEEVIKFLGGTAIALSAIAWLIRSLILHFLNKDVEGYKQRLDKKAFIHRTKFSALHEKQARILEELYSHLLEFISAAEYLVSPSLPPSAPSVQDRAISLDGYSGTFYRYYYKNRIYLSPDLCAKIDELFEAISDSTSRYTFWNAKEEQAPIAANLTSEAWSVAWKTMRTKVPLLKDALETEFRLLLGVDSPSPKKA